MLFAFFVLDVLYYQYKYNLKVRLCFHVYSRTQSIFRVGKR